MLLLWPLAVFPSHFRGAARDIVYLRDFGWPGDFANYDKAQGANFDAAT